MMYLIIPAISGIGNESTDLAVQNHIYIAVLRDGAVIMGSKRPGPGNSCEYLR